MIILAIETSCDETAIALAKCQKSHFKILSNIISSQIKIHQKWGGVVPTLAKREHQKNLVPVLKRALKKAGMLVKIKNKSKTQNKKFEKFKEILIREEHLYKKLEKFLANYKKPKINSIAVTIGPGLEPALWVGINFARALSYYWQLPVVSVNHIEGHIFANFIREETKIQKKDIFPAICLSVAGGHTQLILIKSIGNYTSRDIFPPVEYKLLGETRDDAAGECFDKVAKILGLGYPGGPIIDREAAKLKTINFRAIAHRSHTARSEANGSKDYKLKIKLPRPMIYTKDYDFSFSGLKTAVLYKVKDKRPKERKSQSFIRAMCVEVQQAIIDVLIKKTLRAAKNYKAKTILLSGGVAANKELRKQLKEEIQKEIPHTRYLMPNNQFCTDNAAMIARVACFHWKNGERRNWKEIKANANLKI